MHPTCGEVAEQSRILPLEGAVLQIGCLYCPCASSHANTAEAIVQLHQETIETGTFPIRSAVGQSRG